jgi:hypothetical protein
VRPGSYQQNGKADHGDERGAGVACPAAVSQRCGAAGDQVEWWLVDRIEQVHPGLA